MCSEVSRNLRLVDRRATPRALLDNARRSVVPGGAEVGLIAAAPGY